MLYPTPRQQVGFATRLQCYAWVSDNCQFFISAEQTQEQPHP